MQHLKASIFISLLAGAVSAPAQIACNNSYSFRTDVDGSIGQTICNSNANTFINNLSNFSFTNSNYNETSAANVIGRFSDVTLSLSYAANSTTLNYNFEGLGDSGSFTGATRGQSQDMFKDYIKKHGIIGRIMKYQAQNSATSPLTGVGGLFPTAIAADFNANFDASAITGTAQSNVNNVLGTSIQYGAYEIGSSGDNVKTTSIPLSYTIRNGIDPRRQLNFSLPITLVQVGDAKSLHAGFGVGYRHPMNDRWTLSPTIRYSAIGSADRATAASVYSVSLSSNYIFPLGKFNAAVGNMLGYYATGKISVGDYSANPNFKSIVTRNGLMLSQPITIGKRMSIEYSLIDTRYIGKDKPFLENSQEFGITLGTNKNALDARQSFRAGLAYMRGKDTKGFTVNVGFWF